MVLKTSNDTIDWADEFSKVVFLNRIFLYSYLYIILRYVNAINFEFFLHRDSYVCMIVKIQRQPSIAGMYLYVLYYAQKRT